MPKRTVTIMQALMIRNEINEYSKSSITFRIFNEDKILRFLNYNDLLLKGADRMIEEMVKKYVRHDADGKPVVLESVHGNVKYDFLDDNAAEAFRLEYNSYVSRTREIQF